MRRKKVNLKDKEEAKKYIEKHSFVCERCKHNLSNQRFKTQEELDHHREMLHGEYSKEVHKSTRNVDPSIHSIYMRFYCGEKHESNDSNSIVPPIQKLGDKTYWYHPWKKEYLEYIKGGGLVSNDLYSSDCGLQKCVLVPESTEYFRVILKLVNGDGEIPKEPIPRPKMCSLNVNPKKPIIVFPKRLYIFEKNSKPTSVIDLNKITRRLIYGDDEFGQPERPNHETFGNVSASYNGRWINGAVSEWRDGWLQKKVKQWELSTDSRDKQLLEEYNHPETYDILPNPLEFCLKYLYKEGIYESIPILIELLGEVLYQKFGEDIVSSQNVITVKGVIIPKETQIGNRKRRNNE